jgi:hypothetical protein
VTDEPAETAPDVLFVYARKGPKVHLEQRGLGSDELALLVTSWWLQLSESERGAFLELLASYHEGRAQPPPVALGIAAIVHRGGTSPSSPNGHAE